jgi:hypothetical protein
MPTPHLGQKREVEMQITELEKSRTTASMAQLYPGITAELDFKLLLSPRSRVQQWLLLRQLVFQLESSNNVGLSVRHHHL